jgi:hypothetical protein
MRAITRITGAAAAVALALALTACSDSSDDAGTPAETAATQGSDQDSPPADDGADDAAGSELTAENFAEVMAASMQANTRYRMTTTTSGSGVESTSVTEVHVKDGKAATRTVTETMGQETTIVTVDSDYYMNLGPLTDNKFFKLDLGAEGGEMAKSLAEMAQSISPEQGLEMMKDSIESVEVVGQEDVAGIPTTHYALTLDLSAIGEALGQELGQDAGPTALPTDATSITSDYWVDEDNRIVKTSTEVMGFTTESVYSDWDDESIVIEAPSGAELTDKDPFAGLGS